MVSPVDRLYGNSIARSWNKGAMGRAGVNVFTTSTIDKQTFVRQGERGGRDRAGAAAGACQGPDGSVTLAGATMQSTMQDHPLTVTELGLAE